MSDHAAALRARIRSYYLRVLGALVLCMLGGGFAMALISQAVGDAPTLMGAIGFSLIAGTVGVSLLVHRATVRCPACEKWLVPLGMNGGAPSKCPHCGVPLR